jgi:hypothetical protein
MMSDNIIKFTPSKRLNPDAQKLLDDIKATVYKYEGKVSVSEAFGCLKIAEYALSLQLLGNG